MRGVVTYFRPTALCTIIDYLLHPKFFYYVCLTSCYSCVNYLRPHVIYINNSQKFIFYNFQIKFHTSNNLGGAIALPAPPVDPPLYESTHSTGQYLYITQVVYIYQWTVYYMIIIIMETLQTKIPVYLKYTQWY